MDEYMFDPPEVTCREYLMRHIDAPVHVTAPRTFPTKFVQVQAVGGVAGLVSQRPMVTFICWDASRAGAARFAETVMAIMRSCRELAGLPVYRVRVVGLPTFRPDESGKDRYQFTLEFNVRGKPFEAP